MVVKTFRQSFSDAIAIVLAPFSFVDAVARKNVQMTVADIRKDSPVLAEMESKGAIKMAGAMYNLETGAVDFLD